jgi:hypothetical protein
MNFVTSNRLNIIDVLYEYCGPPYFMVQLLTHSQIFWIEDQKERLSFTVHIAFKDIRFLELT